MAFLDNPSHDDVASSGQKLLAQNTYELLYYSNNAALLSLSFDKALTVDTLRVISRFWKSTLWPKEPVHYVPVSSGATVRVRDTLETLQFDPEVAVDIQHSISIPMTLARTWLALPAAAASAVDSPLSPLRMEYALSTNSVQSGCGPRYVLGDVSGMGGGCARRVGVNGVDAAMSVQKARRITTSGGRMTVHAYKEDESYDDKERTRFAPCYAVDRSTRTWERYYSPYAYPSPSHSQGISALFNATDSSSASSSAAYPPPPLPANIL